MIVSQFRGWIIRPVLIKLGMYSEAAENLLVGTALHESAAFKYIAQYPTGPAKGYYQMEPATLRDLYDNYLVYRREHCDIMDSFKIEVLGLEGNLAANPTYATAAARLQYWRVKEPLPKADDIEGLARYYKKYWNTEAGKATPQQFVDAYKKHHPKEEQ